MGATQTLPSAGSPEPFAGHSVHTDMSRPRKAGGAVLSKLAATITPGGFRRNFKAGQPEQFVSQAYVDWQQQMEALYRSNQPTIAKTVILPPNTNLNDPRLRQGVVVSQRKYKLPEGVVPTWNQEGPFEADIDGRLLPPCWGTKNVHTHYAVYPNKYFKELNCGYCEMHRVASTAE